MKLKSLYQFYRAFFKYSSSKNRLYGRAVSDVNKLFREVLQGRSIIPILSYYRGEYTNPITLKLVNKLTEIAEKSYRNPMDELEYFETRAVIDKRYLTTKRRGIEIPISGALDRKNKKLVLLVYSSSFNLLEESKVLAGLIKHFSVTVKFPVRIYKIEYWNLSKGETKTVDTRIVIPTDKESLIDAANRI